MFLTRFLPGCQLGVRWVSVGCPLGVRWVSVGCPLGVRWVSVAVSVRCLFTCNLLNKQLTFCVNYLLGISSAVFEILIGEPKISQLAHTVFIEKYVSSCKVTMDYLTKDKLKILLPSDFSRVT